MKFIQKWNGHIIKDDGAYTSKEFKTFAKEFKTYLKKSLKPNQQIANFTIGHYYLSGFISQTNGNVIKYVYFSYDIPRSFELDFYSLSFNQKVLYRTAKNDRDYIGGTNRFTKVKDCGEVISDYLVSCF